MIEDLLVELFDELASFVLFGEALDGGFLFFEDLDGVEEVPDLVGMHFVECWVRGEKPEILASASDSMAWYCWSSLSRLASWCWREVTLKASYLAV